MALVIVRGVENRARPPVLAGFFAAWSICDYVDFGRANRRLAFGHGATPSHAAQAGFT